MEQELIAEWMVSLSILAFFYWRSTKIAIADRLELAGQLTKEIDKIKDRNFQAELLLQSQVTEIKSQLQISEVSNAKLAQKTTELIQQCQRLRENLKNQTAQVKTEAVIGGFEQIQSLLTQYPSIQKTIEVRPDLPAQNIVALLTSLSNLVEFWECQPIDRAWEMVKYNPQLHQGDVTDLQSGESVYVRFIGYRQGDRILIPAKVSRTLPIRVK